MAKSPRPADVSPDRETDLQYVELRSGDVRDRVAQRAYERYESRGREDSRDQEDWFEAEREFGQRSSGSDTTAGRTGGSGGAA